MCELFDLRSDDVAITYSNEGLAPWHGGCAIGNRIQLRKEFETRERYFFLRRDELIAHEMVHAFRADQPDSLFEEILAFQTSRSWWRRFFSPIFGSHRETLLFLGAVLGAAALIWVSPWFYLVPGTLALLGLSRLCFRQWQFHRCLRRLRRLVERPYSAIVRLSAEEIIRLGRGEDDQELLSRVAVQALDRLPACGAPSPAAFPSSRRAQGLCARRDPSSGDGAARRR